MATAVVTGASGFIGGHLVEALVKRGDRVRCHVRNPSVCEEISKFDVEIEQGDVLDVDSLSRVIEGADVVYHLAGVTSAIDLDQLRRVNEEGCRNVAEICANQPTPPTLIAASSLAAAGPIPLGQRRTENDPPAPISHYGRSKRQGEQAVEMMAGRLPITIIRPGVVFGPRDLASLQIFQTIRRFRVHPLPAMRTPPLSYIYVEDLVNVLLSAAERGKRLPPRDEPHGTGEGIYFACVDEHPTYAEFGKLVRQTIGRPFAPPLPTFKFASVVLAGTNEWICRMRKRSDTFNLDKIREATVTSWACSPETTIRELGFSPEKPLLDRLHQTAQWYFENGWLR